MCHFADVAAISRRENGVARMALTKKQEKMRAAAVGASEIGVLAGLSRWSTPAEIWGRKTGRIKSDGGANAIAMELGIDLEEPMAKIYARRTGRFLARCDSLRHPLNDFAIATPDRIVYPSREAYGRDVRTLAHEADMKGAERLLQLKSTTWRMRHEWGTPGTDQVPDYYLAQEQWEMGVSGVSVADVGVLFDKDAFEVYTLTFRRDLYEGLEEIAQRFMVDYVLADVMPPADASERFGEVLKKVFPRERPDAKLATADAATEEIALRYAQLKQAEGFLKKHLQLTRNQLEAAIGDGLGFLSPRFGKITKKANRDSVKIDWQACTNEALGVAQLLLASHPMPDEDKGAFAERLRVLIQNNSRTTPGARPLKCTWANEAAIKRTEIDLRLAALEAKDEPEESEQ